MLLSAGIGAQIARQYLTRTSHEVVAFSRSADRAREAILSAVGGGGGGGKSPGLDESRLHVFSVDALDEASLSRGAEGVASRFGAGSVRALWNVNGLLRPEKALQQVSLASLEATYATNTFSHLLLWKHVVPLLPRKNQLDTDAAPGHSVIASLSARVGSITDNAKGGWYSYRSSKAALNQMIKTLAIELQLRNLPAVAVALHPGTVRSALSKDFTGGPGSDKPLDKSKGQFEAWEAAENLYNVVQSLKKDDSGSFRDWKNEKIEW